MERRDGGNNLSPFLKGKEELGLFMQTMADKEMVRVIALLLDDTSLI